jgi:hypothetical protein
MGFLLKDEAGLSKKYSFSIVVKDKLKPAEPSKTTNSTTDQKSQVSGVFRPPEIEKRPDKLSTTLKATISDISKSALVTILFSQDLKITQ